MSSVVDKSLEELTEENKRLLNQLSSVNKFLNDFIKFKSFIDINSDKFKLNLDSNDSQIYEELSQKLFESFSKISNQEQTSAENHTPNETVLELPNNSLNNCLEEKTKAEEYRGRRSQTSLKSKYFVCDHPNCDYKCLSSSSIHKHWTTHGREGPIKCPADGCHKTFFKNFQLTLHLRVHLKAKHICQICQKSFRFKHNLTEHLRNVHSLNTEIISDCNAAEALLSLKNANNQKNEPTNAHKCRVCGLGFFVLSFLLQHLQQIHEIFVCDINQCNEEFASRESLTQHKLNSHFSNGSGIEWTYDELLRIHEIPPGNRNPIKCPADGCEKSVFTNSELKKHLITHMSERVYTCPHEGCDSTFTCERYVRVHKREVHQKKKFRCDFPGCGYTTTKRCRLVNVHRLVHTNERTFICPEKECHKAYKTRDELRRHRKSHSDERPFACSVPGCKAKFKTGHYLTVHQTTHSTERDSVCDWGGCGKQFKNQRQLLQHKTNVHGTANFECDWPGCSYRTHTNSKLRKHMTVHSEERNIACTWPQCEMKFKTKCNLSNHLKLHRNDKRHVCDWPDCGYRSTNSANVKAHVKAMHKKKLSFDL